MLRPANPACRWSTSGLMIDNLQAQLAPLERHGAAELAVAAAMSLWALAIRVRAELRLGARRLAVALVDGAP